MNENEKYLDKKLSIQFFAFLQTTGLVIYIVLLSFLFTFIAPNFQNTSTQFYVPIIMLLLFIISAVISGLLVLGRAGFLFWEKQYKKSLTLVGWTIAWAFLYLLIFIVTISLK
jgi:hypothetical protein